MQQRQRLLSLLADGRFHSGEELGRALGVGRGAVWKMLRGAAPLGVEVFAVRGRGYRLGAPLELLERERILAALDASARALLGGLEVFPEIDSTNRWLLARAGRGLRRGHACLAEYQSAGRGRRGREWVSPYGCNLYLSVYWGYDAAPGGLHGLSLALGVAAAEALAGLGVDGVGLKWPNDLLLGGRKLGGLLIELSAESAGPWHVVAGAGINLRMPQAAAARIDQPWTELGAGGAARQGRNRLAGALLGALLLALERFGRAGFETFRAGWEQRDVTRGREVEVRDGAQLRRGVALGVDADGALLLREAGTTRRFVSGEVSLRMRP